jgi:D-3-phosphoglycerate dehydrogenase
VVRSVRCRDQGERIAACREARVLVVSQAQISEELCAASPHLVGIVRTGIGLDTVDIPGATRQGVSVAHVPDFCHDEVADSTWALLLAVARKIVLADRRVRGGAWEPSALLPMHRLQGRILGLVGFGQIARKVAERGRAFGMRLIAFDPYVDGETMARWGTEKVTFEDLCARAHIISLHTPLTEATRGLIGASALARMQKGAVLINTSRGRVVEEEALIAALRSGRLAGAGLDVLATEPPSPDNPLRQMDTVVLTPHSASTTVEALAELAEKVSRQIVQFLRGEWPTYLANPDVRALATCRLPAVRRTAR